MYLHLLWFKLSSLYYNFFSDVSPWERETKEKIKQMVLYQTKKFCTAKETINKMKRQPTEKEDIFTNTSDKNLMSKDYKELIKPNTKTNKKPNPIKNGQRT